MIITCPDIDEALEFFTRRLDFRLDMIMPADSPRVAIVSGQGICLRLEKAKAGGRPGVFAEFPDVVVCRKRDGGWNTGRAGMEYRDLLPGRLGGRVIASHIRLTRGGDVPDHVHFHKINFQVIYCLKGSVRVVYEDQGPPFWLRPGDCVLQPPEIRHRVLDAEAGSEVIEVGSPAEHQTWIDHEMQLPTASHRPVREFAGQRFVRSVAEKDYVWSEISSGYLVRNTGIGAGTNGSVDVRLITLAGNTRVSDTNDGTAAREYVYFVLEGRVGTESVDAQSETLHSGDCAYYRSAPSLMPGSNAVCRLLEVSWPGSAV